VTSFALTRRGVLAGTAAALVGGVAGFVVAGRSSAARQPGGTTAANAYGPAPTQAAGGGGLVALDRVPPGGGVVLGSQKVVVTRTADGAVHAFSAVCTHQGCTVDAVTKGTIDCPCHGSRFDAGTGAVVAGPAPRALPRIGVEVRDGQVFRT
jgi:Rieske Fe-S protein